MSEKSSHQQRRKGHGGGKRRISSGPSKGVQLDTATQRLVELIVKLGDNTNASTLETHLNDLVSTLVEPSRHPIVLDTVFKCVVALPCKTSIYAVLLTLLCESTELAPVILDRLQQELDTAFRKCDYYAIKFLFRFLIELANSNMLKLTHVTALYEHVLRSLADASTSPADTDFVPQHISDFYVTIILSSILLLSKNTVLDTLLEHVKTLMERRKPLAHFTPFKAKFSLAEDHTTVAQIRFTHDDSVEYLHHCFLEFLKAEEQPSSIRVLIKPYELPSIAAKLFGPSDAPTQPITKDDIEWFNFDTNPTVLFDLITFRTFIEQQNETRIDLGLERLSYPSALQPAHFSNPKPMCRIFPESRIYGEGKLALSPIERWFIEDYTLDTIHFFRSAHADIPKHLSFCKHLKDHFDFEALLCDIIFKDFLRTPASPYPTVHHGVILLDLMQKNATFGPTLIEATERLFGSLSALTAPAISSFVDWFSYHLSNTEFKWNWKEWAQMAATTAPETGMALSRTLDTAQIHFIQEVLSSVIRLSYYDRIAPIITAAAPDCAPQWLPEKPEPGEPPESFYSSPLGLSIMEEIKNRQKPAEALLEPVLAFGMAVPLTSEQVVKVITRAILVEGSTSITLLQATLSKYNEVLRKVAYESQVNLETPKNGGKHILRACLDYHLRSPQHFIIAVLAMLHHKLLDAPTVTTFLLDPEIISQLGHKRYIWEVIDHTIRYVTQAQSVLESEIINNWRLKCKSNPDADPKELALRTMELSAQVHERLSEFANMLEPLMISLFTSLVALLDTDRKNIIMEHYTTIAIKYRTAFAKVLPSLDVLISRLPEDVQTAHQQLKYFSQQF